MLYASKGLIKSYRHYLSGDLDIDTETGEITKRVRQSKGWMRTGDHVKMVEVFGRMRIDQLVFGNGAGMQVANAIRYKAMLPFCKWAKQEIDYDRAEKSEFPFVIAYRDLGTRLRREHGEDILSDEPMRLPRRLRRPIAAPAKNRLKRF